MAAVLVTIHWQERCTCLTSSSSADWVCCDTDWTAPFRGGAMFIPDIHMCASRSYDRANRTHSQVRFMWGGLIGEHCDEKNSPSHSPCHVRSALSNHPSCLHTRCASSILDTHFATKVVTSSAILDNQTYHFSPSFRVGTLSRRVSRYLMPYKVAYKQFRAL